jgi:phage terminase small subunit
MMAGEVSRKQAPGHLSPPTKRWWRSVVSTWELDEHHIRLLTLAGESWDRGQLARQQLQREGLVCATAMGPRAHPAVKIAEQASIIFARLVRELDLDITTPAAETRPPALRSMKGGRGAA